MSLRFPLLPPALFEMHGVGFPVMAPPRSPLLSPAVQLLKVFPEVVVDTDFNLTESPLPPKPGMFTPLPVGGAPAVVETVWFVSVGVPVHVVLPFHRSKVTVICATPSVLMRWRVTFP